jgi:hypothetical protein
VILVQDPFRIFVRRSEKKASHLSIYADAVYADAGAGYKTDKKYSHHTEKDRCSAKLKLMPTH